MSSGDDPGSAARGVAFAGRVARAGGRADFADLAERFDGAAAVFTLEATVLGFDIGSSFRERGSGARDFRQGGRSS